MNSNLLLLKTGPRTHQLIAVLPAALTVLALLTPAPQIGLTWDELT